MPRCNLGDKRPYTERAPAQLPGKKQRTGCAGDSNGAREVVPLNIDHVLLPEGSVLSEGNTEKQRVEVAQVLLALPAGAKSVQTSCRTSFSLFS